MKLLSSQTKNFLITFFLCKINFLKNDSLFVRLMISSKFMILRIYFYQELRCSFLLTFFKDWLFTCFTQIISDNDDDIDDYVIQYTLQADGTLRCPWPYSTMVGRFAAHFRYIVSIRNLVNLPNHFSKKTFFSKDKYHCERFLL